MNDCYRFVEIVYCSVEMAEVYSIKRNKLATKSLNSPVEFAFRPVPKTIKEGSPYTNIWRIEDFSLVTWPKKGKFHKGDSYLIVWIKAEGRHMRRHIHFWIGSETTQDEAAVAAMKAVELDDYFEGQAVQFREIEGYESKIFLSYFPRITYESGGYFSSFTSIRQNYDDKLWHVGGKRNITLNQRSMGWSSMSSKEVFILDISQCMFLWIGKSANEFEKLKAARVAQELNTERVGKVQIVVVNDGEEKNFTREESQLFNKHLPIAMKNLNKLDTQQEDKTSQNFEKNLKLYVCLDEGGVLKVSEVKCGPLVYSDLNSKEIYILLAQTQIWIWVGRLAPKQERREAMNNAMGFAKKKDADLCKIIRVVEGAELEEFKYLFHNWPELNSCRISAKNRVATTVQTNFDVKSLHQNRKLAAEMRMVDDGEGEVEIYRMQNFNMVPVDKAQYGQFFNSDCYIIIYKYNFQNTEYHLLYYWLGIESSPEEQGAAALKTLELDEGLQRAATQIRVIQGKEPPHLMTIFKGRMIILMGSHESWGKKSDVLAACPGRTFMLQVCGTTSFNTKAIQVPMRAAYLNSNDVFVIFDGHRSYIWAGKGSTGDEREMAKNISNGATFIPEGQERPDFWNCLGGIEPYANEKQTNTPQHEHIPRLFCVTNIPGAYKMEEVCNFEQHDLIPDDIMLLDTWDSLFLWIGKESKHDEKKSAIKAACNYLETDQSCRPSDIPVYRVNQEHEPPIFTGFFNEWDGNLWMEALKFDQVHKDLRLNNMNIPINEMPSTKYGGQTFREIPKFSYHTLAWNAPDVLPKDVDPSNKELHLTDLEFMSVFQMTYTEYFQLPMWKKQALKKALGLF